MLYPTIPRAVDDLHLLRERGGSGGVAWPGVMASHARVVEKRGVGVGALRWQGTIL